MTKLTITCDHCGRDITYTTNSEEWRILLKDERVQTHPEATTVTDMAAFRPLGGVIYRFCGMACLSEYAKHQL